MPEEVRKMLGADLAAAHERVRAGVRQDHERAAAAAGSKARIAELRKMIEERSLMNDPEIRAVVDDATKRATREHIAKLRDRLVAKLLRSELETAHPGTEVLDGVRIYEKLPKVDRNEWNANNSGKDPSGLTERPDGLYMQRGEIDMMVIERQSTGKAKVVAREEIKTGSRDTNADARGQLDVQTSLLSEGAAGQKTIRLEIQGRDITGKIDLKSDAAASKSTRGPAGKGFDETLGASAADLERMCKELLVEAAEKGSP